VPKFSTLCNNIWHSSLTLRSRIHLLNLFNYLFGDGFVRLTRLKWKLTVSNIAIFGFAMPSRCHSPDDSNGHIQGQENVKALTIMPIRCQPELMWNCTQFEGRHVSFGLEILSEICALLRCYAAYSFLPYKRFGITYRSRNVGKELPLYSV
jgi:hypothetical protein